MADKAKLLSVNDRDYPFYDRVEAENELSDKEILPDELSTDHGEGHGHGKDAPKASVLGSALNIANTIMGAGILALPNVIRQFGVVLGSGIIALSCTLTYISCVLLLKAKNLSHHSKYISIGKYCFGSAGLWAVKAIIIINNVGLCIVYLIVFSTVGTNLIQGFDSECSAAGSPIYCQQWFLTLAGSLIVTPFVFANSMTKLQGASAVAVLAATIFSVITVEHYIQAAVTGESAKDINILPAIDNIVTALSSVTSVFLAFTFQFNFFPVYKSLQDPSDSRMKSTTGMGLILVLIIYLSVANAGYLTFGADTENLLKNFTKDKLGLVTFIIVNIAFLISSTLTLPLMFFGAKNEIYGAIKILRRNLYLRSQRSLGIEEFEEEDEKIIEEKYGFKGIQYKIYVSILFALVVVLAIFVPGINEVFSFVGSTAANGLNFLLPALFYLRLSSRKGKLRIISWIVFTIGAVMGVVGIVTSALSPS